MEDRSEVGGAGHPEGRRGAKWGSIVAVVAAALGLGAWFFFSSPKPEATPVVRADAPVSATPAATPAKPAAEPVEADEKPPRLMLNVGDRLTYSVNQNQKVSLTIMTDFDFEPPGKGTPPTAPSSPAGGETKTMETKQSMTGQMMLEVLADLDSKPEGKDSQKGWLVEWSISGMSMDMGIQGDEIQQDDDMRRQMALAKDKLTGEVLRSHVRTEVRESGEIGKIVVDADSPEVRNQWRGILSRWQVVLPDAAAVPSWERKEQDDSGTYVAGYEWTSADYPRKLLKRKLRYEKLMLVSPHGPAMQPDHAVEGETRIVLDAYPLSAHGWEKMKVSSKGKGGFTVKGESRFFLELVSAENDPSLAARGAQMLSQFLQNTNVMAWAGEAGPPGGQPPPQTPEDVERLLDLLRKTIQFYGGESPQALGLASLLIKALQSSSDPALVEVIMAALSEDYTDAAYAMVLTGVLGAAGTPPSQKGLLEIIGTDDWPVELKEMAYTSLAQVTEPVSGMENVLIQQYETGPEANRDTALLLLAHAGHFLEGKDDDRRAAVLDYIQGSLANVDAENYGRSLSVALAVLGNLGPTEVPPLVATAAQSSDPWTRSEALASLTRVQTEEAVQLVIQGTQDSDETVRMSAIRTLGEQNPSGGLETLRTLVLKDPSENVRNLAASTLVNSYWGNDTAVTALLQDVAQNDPSEQVRATATAMIEHIGTRPWGTTEDMPEDRPSIP